MPEPDVPSQKTRQFFIQLRGIKTPVKKTILNATLVLFSTLLYKKDFLGKNLSDPKQFAYAQYEPNYVAVQFRMLFAVFHEQGVQYKMTKDFKLKGDYLAFWRYVFAVTKKIQPEYGTRPNKACFDPLFREKQEMAIKEGKLDPYNNYDHFMMVLSEELMVCNILCGSKEPIFLKVSFVFVSFVNFQIISNILHVIYRCLTLYSPS